jgi:hypothetical protein
VASHVGRLSIADIEVRARLERGGSLPEVMTEPVLGFEDVCATVEGVASCGIHEEQVAEVGVGRGGVCPKTRFYFGRSGVCDRGLACTLVVLYVTLGVDRLKVA